MCERLIRGTKGAWENANYPRVKGRRVIPWPGLTEEPEEVLKRSRNIWWCGLTSKSTELHTGVCLRKEIQITRENMRALQSTVFLCLDDRTEILQRTHVKRGKKTKTILEEPAFLDKHLYKIWHKWADVIKEAAQVKHSVVYVTCCLRRTYQLCSGRKLTWGNGKLRKWQWTSVYCKCHVQSPPLNYFGHAT